MLRALIAGIDSAIGQHISKYLASNSWEVYGTSRRSNYLMEQNVIYCDFLQPKSIDECASEIKKLLPGINLLVIAVGLMSPIGKFIDCDIDEWEKTFYINFNGPVRLINLLLPSLRKVENSLVLTFAGGAINSSPRFYTSYNLSKIALTKSMELFAGEEPKIKFISLGTGWVDTPIHQQTISAKDTLKESEILSETVRRYNMREFTDINKITEFVRWAYFSAPLSISGRNISLVNDNWRSDNFIRVLNQDANLYKLRRHKNDEKI
jgi:NAD(P)-dependent dehydrogenase (short-subunit alcohol dehydrogenase family)